MISREDRGLFGTRGTPTRARERNESIIGRQVLTFMVKGQLTVDPRNTLDTATNYDIAGRMSQLWYTARRSVNGIRMSHGSKSLFWEDVVSGMHILSHYAARESQPLPDCNTQPLCVR